MHKSQGQSSPMDPTASHGTESSGSSAHDHPPLRDVYGAVDDTASLGIAPEVSSASSSNPFLPPSHFDGHHLSGVMEAAGHEGICAQVPEDVSVGIHEPASSTAAACDLGRHLLSGGGNFLSLISRLTFGQIVGKINGIKEAAATRLACSSGLELEDFGQVLKDNAFKFELPRFVVIGDEKSGKSSTVERLAMAPVFPRQDEATMTRQPILLKLRFSEDHPFDRPLYILTIPPCKDSRGNTYNKSCVCDKFESNDSDHIITRVRQQMQAVDRSEVGIESECEVVIEMHSNGVPSIDMVDLPGLVQLKPMRGPDLPLLTQNLVKKYLSDDRTGAVICVVNAEVPEVQNAAIFRILADLTEELRSNCIGVFAKTDLSLSRDQGCAKVQKWLQQVINPSSNPTFQTIADTFRAGCVALVNRSTNQDNVSISEQLGHESEFFLHRSGMHAFLTPPCPQSQLLSPDVEARVTFNELGFSCLGLPALICKIDIIISVIGIKGGLYRRTTFLSSLGNSLKRVTKLRSPSSQRPSHARPGQSVCESLTNLGLQPCWVQQAPSNACQDYTSKPCNLGYEPVMSIMFEPEQVRRLHAAEVFALAAQRFDDWLQRYVEDLNVERCLPFELFNSMLPSSMSGRAGREGQIARARGKANLESKIADAIRLNLALSVIEEVKRGLADVFERDDEGEVQLIRFKQISLELIESAHSCLSEVKETFQEVAIRRTRSLFDWASGCNDLENIWGTGVSMHAAVCASVKESVIQVLLMPLLDRDPDSAHVDDGPAFIQKAAAIVKNHDEKAFREGKQVKYFVEEPERLSCREQLEFSLTTINQLSSHWETLIVLDPQPPSFPEREQQSLHGSMSTSKNAAAYAGLSWTGNESLASQATDFSSPHAVAVTSLDGCAHADVVTVTDTLHDFTPLQPAPPLFDHHAVSARDPQLAADGLLFAEAETCESDQDLHHATMSHGSVAVEGDSSVTSPCPAVVESIALPAETLSSLQHQYDNAAHSLAAADDSTGEMVEGWAEVRKDCEELRSRDMTNCLKAKTPEGRVYYFHSASQKSIWKRPTAKYFELLAAVPAPTLPPPPTDHNPSSVADVGVGDAAPSLKQAAPSAMPADAVAAPSNPVVPRYAPPPGPPPNLSAAAFGPPDGFPAAHAFSILGPPPGLPPPPPPAQLPSYIAPLYGWPAPNNPDAPRYAPPPGPPPSHLANMGMFSQPAPVFTAPQSHGPPSEFHIGLHDGVHAAVPQNNLLQPCHVRRPPPKENPPMAEHSQNLQGNTVWRTSVEPETGNTVYVNDKTGEVRYDLPT